MERKKLSKHVKETISLEGDETNCNVFYLQALISLEVDR